MTPNVGFYFLHCSTCNCELLIFIFIFFLIKKKRTVKPGGGWVGIWGILLHAGAVQNKFRALPFQLK